jgi:RNA polymerase sigma-70 factor (ECF subfamily)
MRSPHEHDEDLLRRLRAGDEAAFAALYDRWQGPLYRFALRMSGSAALAEDVTHEVFMALLSGGGFDAGRGALGSYLYGIARNKVLRRLSRERSYVPLEEDREREASADPLDDALRREQVALVQAAVLSLPPAYREAVVLCDLNHLTYGEAAEALGCALGTVRSRLHRGREMLASKLGAREGERTALRRVESAG